MNNINNNKISKFGFLYQSIFIGLETEHYDSATNAFFWIFLTIKIVYLILIWFVILCKII